jgi:hypothetical protein
MEILVSVKEKVQGRAKERLSIDISIIYLSIYLFLGGTGVGTSLLSRFSIASTTTPTQDFNI